MLKKIVEEYEEGRVIIGDDINVRTEKCWVRTESLQDEMKRTMYKN